MPDVWQTDAGPLEQVRPLPGMLRLSRVSPDDAARQEGTGRADLARHPVSELRIRSGRAAGPIRRIHRLQQLSYVQIHATEDDPGTEVSEVRRGRYRGEKDA